MFQHGPMCLEGPVSRERGWWRDATLYVCGELAAASGGRSRELADANNRERTVYARVSRLQLNEMLMQFDYPDANVHAEKRSVCEIGHDRVDRLVRQQE